MRPVSPWRYPHAGRLDLRRHPIDTTADVSLIKGGGEGFAVPKLRYKAKVAVANIDASTFDQIIQKAKPGARYRRF